MNQCWPFPPIHRAPSFAICLGCGKLRWLKFQVNKLLAKLHVEFSWSSLELWHFQPRRRSLDREPLWSCTPLCSNPPHPVVLSSTSIQTRALEAACHEHPCRSNAHEAWTSPTWPWQAAWPLQHWPWSWPNPPQLEEASVPLPVAQHHPWRAQHHPWRAQRHPSKLGPILSTWGPSWPLVSQLAPQLLNLQTLVELQLLAQQPQALSLQLQQLSLAASSKVPWQAATPSQRHWSKSPLVPLLVAQQHVHPSHL